MKRAKTMNMKLDAKEQELVEAVLAADRELAEAEHKRNEIIRKRDEAEHKLDKVYRNRIKAWHKRDKAEDALNEYRANREREEG